MYRTYSNPFYERKTYSTTYVHDPSSNHYFPNAKNYESLTTKPSFLVTDGNQYSNSKNLISSPFHDYSSWREKKNPLPSNIDYKQNPFHRKHVLEDAKYLPKDASFYPSSTVYSSGYIAPLQKAGEQKEYRSEIYSRPYYEEKNSEIIQGQDSFGMKKKYSSKQTGPAIMRMPSYQKSDSEKDIFERLRDQDQSYIRRFQAQNDDIIKNSMTPSFNQKNSFKKVESIIDQQRKGRMSMQEPESPKWPKVDQSTQTKKMVDGPREIQFKGRKFYLMDIQKDSAIRF